jgi:hypothetical protein
MDKHGEANRHISSATFSSEHSEKYKQKCNCCMSTIHIKIQNMLCFTMPPTIVVLNFHPPPPPERERERERERRGGGGVL